MDADPALRWAKLVLLSHLRLPLDFITEGPDACLVCKADFLHTIDLRVLDLKPADVAANTLFSAITVLEADLQQGHSVLELLYLFDIGRLARIIDLFVGNLQLE